MEKISVTRIPAGENTIWKTFPDPSLRWACTPEEAGVRELVEGLVPCTQEMTLPKGWESKSRVSPSRGESPWATGRREVKTGNKARGS